MSQRTHVLKLDGPAGAALESRLAAGAFEFRQVPHTRFSAKGEGHLVTLYSSGKLVVQGPEPEAFCLARGVEGQGVGGAGSAESGQKRRNDRSPDASPGRVGAGDGDPHGRIVCTVGSDEAGKGDFLGPLVVCALRLEAEEARKLEGGGVVDSKQLGDRRALELGAALREWYQPSVVRLDPAEYNAAWERAGNLNVLLAELHARAIGEVAQPGDRVLVDQFGPERLMVAALDGVDVRLEQRPRAEEELAVAAASIVARAEFLLGLAELSSEASVELAKGAGESADRSAREFCRLHSVEALGRVAKLHFKNTGRVL